MARPTAWRLTSLAFATWAAAFVAGYAAALVDPDGGWAKAALAAVTIAAIPAFWWIARQAGTIAEAAMVRAAVAVAALATGLQALVMLA